MCLLRRTNKEMVMAVLCKFDELRIKTGNQILHLVNKQLDLGIREARQALGSADAGVFAEDHYLRAKEAFAEASRLILLAGEIADDERCEARLKRLQEMLEGLSAVGATASATEECVPALARALWNARGCPEGSPEDDWFQAELTLKSQLACVGR
jgi:hypothetical protein